MLDTISWAVGFFIITFSLFRVARFFYNFFIRPSVNLKKYGQWAVVTGATDGIGRAYCHEFARKGLNICLISRSLDKLKKEAEEIERDFKVQTKVIAFDFNTNDNEKLSNLYKSFADLDIGVLVNNVGISYEHPMYLEELQVNSIESMINLNIRAVTLLTKFVLPSMVEKKKGAIINLASISGVNTCPLLSVYAGTKAFVEKFSVSLHYEYASKGVFIQSVTPALVCSNMSKIRRSSFFTPLPKAFARSAVATIGHDRNTTGYWTHEMQAFAIRTLPVFIIDKVMFGLHFSQRKRALNKKKSN
ncbi:hypothetical protein CYY_001809 [Polysphondylium violaceum]|uniref:Steroid dehydrogenase n=1 Tax=Polysphondylium violaceum TaxID=133409 RepID=A0A8J4UVU5_9MYCE|nr:hypothetical protein CYY_001809 [Polysphondylium violaceum]